MILVCIFLILIFIMDTLPSTYTTSYKSTKFCQQKSHYHLPIMSFCVLEYVCVNAGSLLRHHISWLLKEGISLAWNTLIKPDWLANELLGSLLTFHFQLCRYKLMLPHPASAHECWNFNSEPHANKASTLPTEPPPEPSPSLWVSWLHHSILCLKMLCLWCNI